MVALWSAGGYLQRAAPPGGGGELGTASVYPAGGTGAVIVAGADQAIGAWVMVWCSLVFVLVLKKC